MNSSTLSTSTLGHSAGQRTPESQDSELTSSATQTSKILNQMKSELQEQKQRKRFLKELHAKRVQSLRKELDYLKATEWRYQPIDRYVHTETAEENIDEVISRIKCAEETETAPTAVDQTEAPNEEGCYYKTGTVTQVSKDYVLIDDCYTYEKIDDLTNNLKVGDKIQYLLYLRDAQAKPKVRKIICTINSDWDDSNVKLKSDVHTQMILRSIIAKVTKREGRIAIVEPNHIHIDLYKIRSDFVPLIGDWLILESLVELNDESTDLSGEILEVDRIKPLRSQLDVGVISKYNPDSEVGVIDKRIIFYKRACDTGYIPCVGDKVVSDSIESDQGQYNWRSVTVVPLFQTSIKPATSYQKLPEVEKIPFILDSNDLLKNKYGIIIDDELKFNLNVGEESILRVAIKNNGSYAHLLQNGCFMPQKSPSQLSLVSPNIDTNIIINPFENVTYTFKCEAKFVGTSEELFTFNFKDFKIARVFYITVKSKRISQKMNVASVKQKREQNYLSDLNELIEITCIPGIRPTKPPQFIKVRSGVFKVPRYIWNVVWDILHSKKSQTEYEIAVGEQIPCLLKPLSFDTYKEHFHILLYLEEIALTLSLQQYDMKNAIMRRHNDYLVLEVPGLAEKRPSLLVGDRAIISFHWDSSQGNLKYEGFIHKVNSKEVFLKFNEKFHQEYNGENCQVSFKSSYTTLQRCHNAVNLTPMRLGADFLFPTKVVQKKPQFYLEEYEAEDKKPTRVRRHTKSVSSNSSSSSFTSLNDVSSDNTIKVSPRVSVAERLFNTKPAELSFEEATMSTTQSEINQNFKTNSTRNASRSKTNMASRTANESSADTDDELEPYIAQIKTRKLNWFNRNLNYYQKEAVKNIILGIGRPLPYVIFGPPGTGKTVTLCETILQISVMIPESRLLVATPSNSSANLIAERLLDSNILKPGDLVRLIAFHCLDNDSIPEKLLPYCATAELAAEGSTDRFSQQENGVRLNCTMSVLGRHRITVGTCSTLGILYNMGFPRGHFSHILIDEAGQATEPEIMIPLNFIQSDTSQVILAGDPMQLGPVVHSRLASYFGFGESFLVRLLHQFPYQKDPEGFKTGYDPRLVTKLIMNYRSLPEILDLPNSLFYDSELQPQIASKNSKEAELLELLRAELPERNESPPAIIFHGVNGNNYRDSDSPSWYNPEEATQVYLYLLKLYKYGIEPTDIGVITPYLKQVQQIRDLLLELDLKLPKISSVEGFQGQERKIIIISTVRSSNNLIDEDLRHALGFVASPRRLNVAITRARALLIILGNPKLLSSDPYWRSVLQYCIDHDAYTGCNFLPSYMTNLQNVNSVSHHKRSVKSNSNVS